MGSRLSNVHFQMYKCNQIEATKPHTRSEDSVLVEKVRRINFAFLYHHIVLLAFSKVTVPYFELGVEGIYLLQSPLSVGYL